jgi:hypothetical protein
MPQEEANEILLQGGVTDVKPIRWADDASLDVTFADVNVWHAIRDRLAGKVLPFSIRPVLPKIINAMYDDCLRARRDLITEAKQAGMVPRRLYVDTKISAPYICLIENVKGLDRKSNREAVLVNWTDPRFRDPVANHEAYTYPALDWSLQANWARQILFPSTRVLESDLQLKEVRS